MLFYVWGMEFISAQIALSKGQHTQLLKSTTISAKKILYAMYVIEI